MNTNIVFLDIDGVLNGFSYWPPHAGRKWIDVDAVERLNRITQATKAQIVITSTWRKFCDARSLLKDAGVVAEIVGETPFLEGATRGEEIQAWLAEHLVHHFVILDDDADMGELLPWLVKPAWDVGLEEHHVPEAIIRLSIGVMMDRR